MVRFLKRPAVAAILVVPAILGLSAAIPERGQPAATSGYTAPFYSRLAEVRRQRKAQVTRYFDAVRRLAEGIVDDTVMMDAFLELRGRADAPNLDTDLRLDAHYVTHYGEFFDILLVDRSGYVFHSMRRESDYHSNLLTGPLANTKLARHLRGANDLIFVDYELYPPSDELAAFFVVRVLDPDQDIPRGEPGELTGWFVLQCPLNKLNSILTDRRGLGRTGEVYCVNAEQRMVTESRFRPELTELRLKVETAAVSAALASGAGRCVLRDYRDVRVLSSYESFKVYGTKWAIIAEIDEREAITEHYRQHEDFYREEIVRYLGRTRIEAHGRDPVGNRAKRVDMNEFRRAASGGVLKTSGVATCTAITAVLPDRFGYLANKTQTNTRF